MNSLILPKSQGIIKQVKKIKESEGAPNDQGWDNLSIK